MALTLACLTTVFSFQSPGMPRDDSAWYRGVSVVLCLLIALAIVWLLAPASMRNAIRFRPGLRFSLRTFFVLVTILCIWLGYHLNWIRQRRESRIWIEQHEGIWTTDHSYRGLHLGLPAFTPEPPLGLRLLGEEGVCFIRLGEPTFFDSVDRDRRARELKLLFPEAYIDRIDNAPRRPTKP